MAEPILTDATTLVQEGRAALMAGDTYAARQYFRQALEIDPERIDGWIGLAGSVRAYREKRDHLQRALQIDPQHGEACAILAQVEARMAAGEVLAPGGVQVREPEPTQAAIVAPYPQRDPALPGQEAVPAPPILYCYNHPTRETGLHCTNCERPICAECVRPAPVGQLCPACAKARRPVNYQVGAGQLVVAGLVAFFGAALIGLPAVFLLGSAGFFSFIIAFVLGPIIGEALVRIADRLTHNKRGRSIQIVFGVCYAIGIAPWLLLGFSFGLLIFAGIALTTAVTRLR